MGKHWAKRHKEGILGRRDSMSTGLATRNGKLCVCVHVYEKFNFTRIYEWRCEGEEMGLMEEIKAESWRSLCRGT